MESRYYNTHSQQQLYQHQHQHQHQQQYSGHPSYISSHQTQQRPQYQSPADDYSTYPPGPPQNHHGQNVENLVQYPPNSTYYSSYEYSLQNPSGSGSGGGSGRQQQAGSDAPFSQYSFGPSSPTALNHQTSNENPHDQKRRSSVVPPEFSSQHNGFFKTFRALPAASFMVIILIQAGVVLSMISVVYSKIEDEIIHDNLQLRTIKLYLAFFIFAQVYSVGMTIDAFRLKNIISLCGVIIFLLAMMVYGALMGGQVSDVLEQANNGVTCPNAITCFGQNELYDQIHAFIVVIPCVLGGASVILSGLTWFVYKQFGWTHFKLLGADLRIKNMYFWYQVYVTFLKFDIVFFFGFSLQFIILVLQDSSDAEFGITIAALPITILLLLLAAIAVRTEKDYLVWLIFAGEVAGMVYFIYKMVRLFNAENDPRYRTSRKTLGVFSIMSLIMLFLTFALTVKTYINFGNGLKEHMPHAFRLRKRRQSNANALQTEKPSHQATQDGGGRAEID